jgi:hypothetical protein
LESSGDILLSPDSSSLFLSPSSKEKKLEDDDQFAVSGYSHSTDGDQDILSALYDANEKGKGRSKDGR